MTRPLAIKVTRRGSTTLECDGRTIGNVAPGFRRRTRSCVARCGQAELASDLPLAELERWTYDEGCVAAHLYIRAGRELNFVEKNLIGVKHGQTIMVEHRYWVNVDTDNFGRLRGIEVLDGQELAAHLTPLFAPN